MGNSPSDTSGCRNWNSPAKAKEANSAIDGVALPKFGSGLPYDFRPWLMVESLVRSQQVQKNT